MSIYIVQSMSPFVMEGQTHTQMSSPLVAQIFSVDIASADV
jgi:hypothetical protein